MIIAVLILLAVVAAGFIAWEVYFSRLGRRAIVEQHHVEGNDEPPHDGL